MKLYYFPVSAYSQKALITLYAKGIEFDRQLVNLGDPEVHAAYKRDINPLGKVPHLILDDGWQIPESSIIMEYLDTHFDGGPQLIPDDKDLARQARFFDRMGDLYVINPATSNFFELRKPEAARNDDVVAKNNATLQTVFGISDKMLAEKKWHLDGRFTMADISTFCGCTMFQVTGGSLADWPGLQAWYGRVAAEPGPARVLAEAQAFMKQAG